MRRPWFEVIEPRASESPVVVEVPHAGLFVPAEALANLVAPARAIARDADLFVDELYEDAPEEGATLLIARTSRYVVDLNRAEDDIDSGVVAGAPRPPRPHARGLIWRTTTDDDAALVRPLTREEYAFRIEAVHRPYHDTLKALLERKFARFGYAILLCAHSMPSVGRVGHSDAGIARADVVPGSRGRTSAHKRIIDAIDTVAVSHGRSVEHDRPYRGGWSTSFYGRPAAKLHAIQVELARRLYLDENTLARQPSGLSATKRLCRAFVARLAGIPRDALT